MHQAVIDYVQWILECVAEVPDTEYSVLEFGSKDLNGSVRPLFHDATTYVGVDYQEGPGVDVVADAADYRDGKWYDYVICTEVLEHCPYPVKVVENALRRLREGGHFIATMAGPGREPHSAIVEGPPQDGEWYANISKEHMVQMLQWAGFSEWSVTQAGADLQVWARR